MPNVRIISTFKPTVTEAPVQDLNKLEIEKEENWTVEDEEKLLMNCE